MLNSIDMNTIKKGKFRYIVFKDGDTWYAVALEFNIVESADEPRLALMSLFQAVSGYLTSLKKVKGTRFAPLNQKPDPEYDELWKKITSPKPVKSPYEIGMFGVSKV
jgi:hypothetical protein